MSLLGRKPISIPDGVTVTADGSTVHVRGPLGVLSVRQHAAIAVEVVGATVRVAPRETDGRTRGISAQWGTQWSLVLNAIAGVVHGVEKRLELHGVGYRAEIVGRTLKLNVGFTHIVELTAPEDISVVVEKNVVTVRGTDKQRVGAFAAEIRRVRPPEPYKGKGIRYVGEVVRRKEGKVVGTTAGGA